MHINIEEFVEKIKEGNRSYLSRAITLAESTRLDHQEKAWELINRLLPLTGKAKRIAITGVPGVGKSTFIESFGKFLTDKGLKVAVLAIDPSSTFSKGSILGDKTRMEDLAKEENAYIRPSATWGSLGGITARTYEAMLLCEAAGFDVILVETVGVGQSETTVNDITDFFLFLQVPGTGDELQGIKRGIMEMADLIFVNKVDDFGEAKTKDLRASLARSLQFVPPKESGWKRKVLLGSGLNGKGLEQVWEQIEEYYAWIYENNYLEENRNNQDKKRIREYILENVSRKTLDLLKKHNEWESTKSESPYETSKEWLNKYIVWKDDL